MTSDKLENLTTVAGEPITIQYLILESVDSKGDWSSHVVTSKRFIIDTVTQHGFSQQAVLKQFDVLYDRQILQRNEMDEYSIRLVDGTMSMTDQDLQQLHASITHVYPDGLRWFVEPNPESSTLKPMSESEKKGIMFRKLENLSPDEDDFKYMIEDDDDDDDDEYYAYLYDKSGVESDDAFYRWLEEEYPFSEL